MKTTIYDNGGKTCDRYTVIIGSSVYGMSDDAMMPNGFNQYAGELSEFPARPGFPHSFADGWPVAFAKLPVQVQSAIEARKLDI